MRLDMTFEPVLKIPRGFGCCRLKVLTAACLPFDVPTIRDSVLVFLLCQDNAVPIQSWFSDPADTALLNLLPMLDALRFVGDVRSVLSRNLHIHRI